MSSPDDSKEIPARQAIDIPQPEPWRIESDNDGTGELLVLNSNGQIVAILIPIEGDGDDGADTRARATRIAKAPEMHRLLTRVTTIVDGDGFNVHVWLAQVEALLKRAE